MPRWDGLSVSFLLSALQQVDHSALYEVICKEVQPPPGQFDIILTSSLIATCLRPAMPVPSTTSPTVPSSPTSSSPCSPP